MEFVADTEELLTVVGVGNAGCRAARRLETNKINGVHLVYVNTVDGLRKQGIAGIEIPSEEDMGTPVTLRSVSGNLALKPYSDTESEPVLISKIKLSIQAQLNKKKVAFHVDLIEESELFIILADLLRTANKPNNISDYFDRWVEQYMPICCYLKYIFNNNL